MNGTGSATGYRGEGTTSRPYVDPDTGEHIIFGKPYLPSFPDVTGIEPPVGFGRYVPPGRDRSDDVVIASAEGFTLGRNAGGSRGFVSPPATNQSPVAWVGPGLRVGAEAKANWESKIRLGVNSASSTVNQASWADLLGPEWGGYSGEGALGTSMSAAQFGGGLVDMYVKAPFNLIPGLASEVVNGYVGLWNLATGNGPQVGKFDWRPFGYSSSIAGELGEFGFGIAVPEAVAGRSAGVRAGPARATSVIDHLPEHALAAQKGFPGVRVTQNGGPTFAGSDYLYPIANGQSNVVEISLTGSRRGDFAAANRLAGLEDVVSKGAYAPKGYVWHHVDNYDLTTGRATLELVQIGAHNAAKPHVGSVKQWELIRKQLYRD